MESIEIQNKKKELIERLFKIREGQEQLMKDEQELILYQEQKENHLNQLKDQCQEESMKCQYYKQMNSQWDKLYQDLKDNFDQDLV